MGRSLWASVVACLALAVLGSAGAWAAEGLPYPPAFADDSPAPRILSPDVTLVADTIPLNPYQRKLDGQWLGNAIGSDGKVYFASSSHAADTAGMMFQYDPGTRQLGVLSSDLSVTAGENAKTMVPQGKIHTNLVEHDGWLYGATHLANYWPSAYSRYTGAHLLSYKMGSLEANSPQFRDFGIPTPNSTCYAGLSVDPVHDYVYMLTTSWWGSGAGGVYRYNTDGTGKTLLRSFGAGGGQSFYNFVDQRGDMWFAHYGDFGTLYKVNGATGAISTYGNALPMKRNQLSNTQNSDTWGRAFLWGAPIDGNKFLFSMHGDGGIWEFDASKMADGNPSDAFRLVKWIGTHTLGAALGGDTVYYLQSANPNWTGPEQAADHHLKSFSLSNPNAAVTDWGRVVDAAGRTPYRAESISADANGHVYLVGDWRVKPEEIGTNVSSLTYDSATGNYYNMWRGQFFASVTVPEPASLFLLAMGALLLRRRVR